MGRRINRMLRWAAARGINMSPVQAHRAVHRPKPKAKAPAPAPKPAASNKVTLKPLVNKKGKVVGMGHFKGNETQDKSAIPKKAPTTKAGKTALADAISKTNNNIASAAKKKQAEVLPKPKLAVARAKSSGITDAATLANIAKADKPLKAAKTGTQRKAVLEGAIASGVDPVAAKGLGLVKKIPTAVKKSKAQIAVAQAGGDVQSQIDVANSKQPIKKAKASIPGVEVAKDYGEKVKRINAYNSQNLGTQVNRGSAFGESGVIKDKGSKFRRKSRGRRRSNPQSAGGSSLKVNLNASSNNRGINP